MQLFPLITIFIFDYEFLRAWEAFFSDDRATDDCFLPKVNFKPTAVRILCSAPPR